VDGIGVTRNLGWGPDHRGAEGAEIETPKASSGKGMGSGCPPPQPTRGSGERRKLPQRSPGRSPCRKLVLEYLEVEKTHLIATESVIFDISPAYI